MTTQDNETTDIATRDATLPADYPDEDPGEGVAADVVSLPPWLSLCQSTSDAVKGDQAKPGQWYCKETMQAFDSMRVVAVHTHEEYDCFEMGEDPCKSFDCKKPRGDIERPRSSSCDSCPDKLWRGKKPPPCRPVHVAIVVDVDTEDVYRVSFARTSVKPFKQYLSALRRAKRSLYAMSATLTSKVETRKGNEYRVAAFEGAENVDPWHQYKPLYDEADAQYKAALEGVEVTQSEEDMPF